ncbi:MAG: Patatin [Chthoniobacteraceae bacterium]|nr:Patatin [Chthoniobacteraceae bacterium]
MTPKPKADAAPQRGSPLASPADLLPALSPLPIDAEALRPHPILSLIPPRLLDRFLAGPAFAEYPKGTVVFKAGAPCDAIYLIISGRCESLVRGDNGVSVVEEVFGPGDTLGERSLLNHEPHRSTVTVATHSVLLRLPAAEMRELFAGDASIAGRFAQTVTERVRRARENEFERGAVVRRIVSLLPLASRINAPAVTRMLAKAVHGLGPHSTLLLHITSGAQRAALGDWPDLERTIRSEFRFQKELRENESGFFELALSAGNEPRNAGFIAPLLSHCGHYFDFVLLHVDPDIPVPICIESMIQSDLSFVLMQPSMQNLYDFQLLIRELSDRNRGDCLHVKPILFAEEHVAASEMHATLKQLGHPVHSFARGFPLDESRGDHRFVLHINRLAREIARCRVGLAFSSGGAKGLAHIGVIQVLEENGIEIDCISGASMGAYIGAIWAYGLDGVVLEKLAHEHQGRWGIWSLIDPVLPPRQGFMQTGRIVRRLRRSIGEAHFSDLIRPLRIVATHLDTLERVVFSSGDVAESVAASIAIPGVCVPVTLDGETYIDGGIADPLPVDVLEEAGIERIIAVNVIPPPERLRCWLEMEREQNGHAISRSDKLRRTFGQQINYFAHGNILDTMLQAVNGAQTRVAEGAALHADVLLRPLACDASWHDFTNPGKYIALGRKAAEEQLGVLKSLVHSYEGKLPNPHLADAPGIRAA